MFNIAVFVGSLRRDSTNLQFARGLEKLAAPQLAFHYIPIGNLPLYDDDLWENPPATVLRLKQSIIDADAVLIVTPEYNRSIPAPLKNAIDWASHPHGDSAWTGKPASVVGSSPGVIGSAVAQSHLRSILPAMGVTVMGQPEVYLQMQPGLIDEHFDVVDETARVFLQDYVASFIAFVEHHADRPAANIAAE